jgi:hypothetical protein
MPRDCIRRGRARLGRQRTQRASCRDSLKQRASAAAEWLARTGVDLAIKAPRLGIRPDRASRSGREREPRRMQRSGRCLRLRRRL